MNKRQARRIAHLIAFGQINNFIGAGGVYDRWPETDANKVADELAKLAQYHDDRTFDAVIPSEGGDESRQRHRKGTI